MAIAARQWDGGEGIEVEIDNLLRAWAVAESRRLSGTRRTRRRIRLELAGEQTRRRTLRQRRARLRRSADGRWLRGCWGKSTPVPARSPDTIMTGARPAAHDFIETSPASRGWPACIRHDPEGFLRRSSQFGYFRTALIAAADVGERRLAR